jgi:hypothetical protein
MSTINLQGLGSTYTANPVNRRAGVNGAGDVVALGAIALVVGVGAGVIFGLWKLMDAANPI